AAGMLAAFIRLSRSASATGEGLGGPDGGGAAATVGLELPSALVGAGGGVAGRGRLLPETLPVGAGARARSSVVEPPPALTSSATRPGLSARKARMSSGWRRLSLVR